MAAFLGQDAIFWTGLGLGLIGGFLLFCFFGVIIVAKFVQQQDVYDNDHWKLNVRVPFATMWMNMGYWVNAEGNPIRDFEEACCALLHEVLSESGVLEKDAVSSSKLAILDLGIGCGDQSWELRRLLQARGWGEYRYVGLTLNPTQFQLAANRLCEVVQKLAVADRSIQVFRADAARPDSWETEINNAVLSLKDDHTQDQERWVLALDTLYHFFPSRRPILNYAVETLDASFMAFDLILNDGAPFWQKLVAKIIGLAMKCPAGAFVTEVEYKSQLKAAGYDEKHIHFRDITDHVFSGLVSHIKHQEEVLRPFGISVSKFKVAGKIFGWFAKSGVLRATIVIARNKPKRS